MFSYVAFWFGGAGAAPAAVVDVPEFRTIRVRRDVREIKVRRNVREIRVRV